MTMRTLSNEKGVSLIMTVATLLILSLMAVVLLSLVGTETFSALNQTQSLQTFDIAEAGAHRAITYLGLEAGECTSITGAGQFTDVPMGRGTFTVTATHYNPTSTTLSADIDNLETTTTIPVASTADFAPHGRIHIKAPAPQVDAVKTEKSTSSSMTISSFTVSGTDRLLIVGISQGNVSAPVTSLTYGGTPLTLLGTESAAPPRIEMWYLLDPPAGTADVALTFSGTPSDGSIVGVISLTNVNQTTPFRPFVSKSGNDTASVDVTSAEGELVIDVMAKDTTLAPAAGSGQTERWNIPFTNALGALSTKPGADTVTMAWWNADDWAMGAVSIKPLDPEAVNYADKTANSFTGALRGVNGTTRVSHLTGAVVTQDQCLITSTGTIPGPSGPSKRVVQVGVEYP